MTHIRHKHDINTTYTRHIHDIYQNCTQRYDSIVLKIKKMSPIVHRAHLYFFKISFRYPINSNN